MSLEEDIKQGKSFENAYEKLMVNVMYTNSWLMEQQNSIFKPFGLTVPQYNVLRILRGAYPEPCTINSLIDRMLDRMSNASRIVDRLESKQLVLRKVSKVDRRAKDVVITDEGLKLLAAADADMYAWIAQFETMENELFEKASDTLDLMRGVTTD